MIGFVCWGGILGILDGQDEFCDGGEMVVQPGPEGGEVDSITSNGAGEEKRRHCIESGGVHSRCGCSIAARRR